jgi:hypothetical protein
MRCDCAAAKRPSQKGRSVMQSEIPEIRFHEKATECVPEKMTKFQSGLARKIIVYPLSQKRLKNEANG